LRVSTLKSLLAAAAMVGAGVCAAQAQAPANDMRPPRLTSANVDWNTALRSLAQVEELRMAALGVPVRPPRANVMRPVPKALARLNNAMAPRFPGVNQSPVPVLLPFDTDALMRDLATGTAQDSAHYLSGFRPSNFFFPGPSGYDAVFSLRTADVAQFNDIKFPEPIDVLISGSSLLYELDDPTPAAGNPAPELEADFPGIRRLIHEHHLRYTFVRYGVPYIVSTPCFHASVSRYKMPTCAAAERVLLHFLKVLRVAGGTPAPSRIVQPLAIERPREASPDFSYLAPGRLLPGTGFRDLSGRDDDTVYAQIRFPLADAPAYVNSQMFQSRNRHLVPGQEGSPNYAYPWRDNFCERRGFPVGQCPGGLGHQGQDIRTPRCPSPAPPDAEPCTMERDLVAVRDGAILRRPKQEAVYLFVNTANEHLRFRYLHMLPRKMDEDSLLSGRRVREGEVIAQVGNFSRKEGGTSYHLHFDVQVPTRDGWVFVNPYMTLIAAYERLIGGRGEPISTAAVAAVEAETNGSGASASRAKSEKVKRHKKGKRVAKNSKRSKHVKRGKSKPKHHKLARQ
jgi:hypothetical protein